jgi:hypothetical protein
VEDAVPVTVPELVRLVVIEAVALELGVPVRDADVLRDGMELGDPVGKLVSVFDVEGLALVVRDAAVDREEVPEPVVVRVADTVRLPEAVPVGVLDAVPEAVFVTEDDVVRLAEADRVVVTDVDAVLDPETLEETVAECVGVLLPVGVGDDERDPEDERVPVVDLDDVLVAVDVADDDAVEELDLVAEFVALDVTVAEDVLEDELVREDVGLAVEDLVVEVVRVVVGDALDVLEDVLDPVEERVPVEVRDAKPVPVAVLEFAGVFDPLEVPVDVREDVEDRVLIAEALVLRVARADRVAVNVGLELVVGAALRELERDAVAVNVLNAAAAANCLSRAGLTTINLFSNGGVSPCVTDNTKKAKRPRRRIISLVDSAFFLKVGHGRLNRCISILGNVADLYNYMLRKK